MHRQNTTLARYATALYRVFQVFFRRPFLDSGWREMQDELTPEQQRSYENGIRIFARWIARAYIKDVTEQKLAMNESGMNKKEENDNGDQGSIRGNQAAEAGQNQAGRQKGKRRRG
jgi:hypothetical protein